VCIEGQKFRVAWLRSGLSLHQLKQLTWTEAYTYFVEYLLWNEVICLCVLKAKACMIRSGLSLHQFEQLIWTEAYTCFVEHLLWNEVVCLCALKAKGSRWYDTERPQSAST